MENHTKITIETTDEKKAIRMLKADDMAYFIWELVHNGWRKFKHSEDYDYEPAWDRIHELLQEHNINIDELT
jgi:hypothetical protein